MYFINLKKKKLTCQKLLIKKLATFFFLMIKKKATCKYKYLYCLCCNLHEQIYNGHRPINSCKGPYINPINKMAQVWQNDFCTHFEPKHVDLEHIHFWAQKCLSLSQKSRKTPHIFYFTPCFMAHFSHSLSLNAHWHNLLNFAVSLNPQRKLPKKLDYPKSLVILG